MMHMISEISVVNVSAETTQNWMFQDNSGEISTSELLPLLMWLGYSPDEDR